MVTFIQIRKTNWYHCWKNKTKKKTKKKKNPYLTRVNNHNGAGEGT